MIDSTAYEKETVASKSKENMIWLLETYQKILKNVIIITVTTKQDTQPTMDIQDIGNSWVNDKTLMNLLQGHDWRIFSCNNLTGEGLDSIFDYITLKLNQARTSHQSLNRPISLLSPTPSVNQQIDIITPWDQLPNPHHFSDQEFYTWFYQGKAFLFFDYICLIRIIYLSMAQHQSMQPLFEQLEYILSLMPEIDTFKSISYSETQTLFWIQMVSFALLKSPLLEGENNDFESFLIQSQLDEDCWKTYYTHKLFNSDKATKEFMPPDKKSLPNAFRSSSLNLKGSQLNINYQVL